MVQLFVAPCPLTEPTDCSDTKQIHTTEHPKIVVIQTRDPPRGHHTSFLMHTPCFLHWRKQSMQWGSCLSLQSNNQGDNWIRAVKADKAVTPSAGYGDEEQSLGSNERRGCGVLPTQTRQHFCQINHQRKSLYCLPQNLSWVISACQFHE